MHKNRYVQSPVGWDKFFTSCLILTVNTAIVAYGDNITAVYCHMKPIEIDNSLGVRTCRLLATSLY